ncbi:bacterio-opsin activator domain-containing protein [Haloarculaceae archaeon H-GB2-1]|nr:bacterio-opsin activator domain-containing protein [Haloarculaceae archaeon H-GB11]MEA5410029.1 bacterio-opsin activator domain-containing protein [Haloarculaceae archaeon H-GB2-1]
MFANEAVGGLLGIDLATVTERSIDAIFREAAGAHPADQVRAAVEESDRRAVEFAVESESVRVAAIDVDQQGSTYVAVTVRERRSGSDEEGPESRRDTVDRKRDEERLEALNETTRELLTAESADEIAQIGVETIAEQLPYDVAAVRLFDESSNALELRALTDSAAALLDSEPAYDLEATYAGTAYRRGEPLVNDPTDDPLADEHVGRPSLHVPVQGFGTLSVLATDANGFDEGVVEFVRLLGVTLGIVLERVTRERTLREQRDELDRSNRVNALVRDIIQSLLDASTRSEIESTICERIVASDLYEYAWIGKLGSDDEIVPSTSAGDATGTLHPTAGTGLFEAGMDAISDAVASGEIETVRQYHVAGQDVESSASVTDAEPFEVVAAIPLEHRLRIYGVLVVNTTRMEILGERARAEFELLGEVAGFAINAVRNQQLLLSNRVVELEFEVTDESSLVVAVSKALDCRCNLEVRSSDEGDGVRCYLRLADAARDDVERTLREIPAVEAVDVVTQTGQEYLVEIIQTEPLSRDLIRTGATIRTAVGDGGTGTVVLEAPQSADVREIVDRYQSLYPESSLVAKRERECGSRGLGQFRQTVADELTEQQQRVLEAAYEAGYFEWPRDRTGESIAEALGISSPTLHQHLREAERKVLSAFLEDDERASRD